MIVTIEIMGPTPGRNPTKQEMDIRIAAVSEAIKKANTDQEFMALQGVRYILNKIREQLPSF